MVGSHHDVADVIRVAQQSKPAHVVELAALRIKSAAGVGIVGGQRVDDLRHRQVIAVDAAPDRAAPDTA